MCSSSGFYLSWTPLQILLFSKFGYYHIHQLRCIRLYLNCTTAYYEPSPSFTPNLITVIIFTTPPYISTPFKKVGTLLHALLLKLINPVISLLSYAVVSCAIIACNCFRIWAGLSLSISVCDVTSKNVGWRRITVIISRCFSSDDFIGSI